MNLPSIFKNNPPRQPQKLTEQRAADPGQDMFGLGIQVFKIQSRREPVHRSLGKIRRELKQSTGEQHRASLKINNLVPINRNSKGMSIVPSLSKTSSERDISFEEVAKTDSIMSKKIAGRHTNYLGDMGVIKEYIPPSHFKNKEQEIKRKTISINRKPNKTEDPIAETVCETVIKDDWRPSLNVVPKFMAEARVFSANDRTRAGRKKNQQYLGFNQSFVDAYLQNEAPFFESSQIYDPYSIQHFTIQSQSCHYNQKRYQQFQTA